MAGTLTVGQLVPDVGTNLYINAQQYGGNVIVGNTTTTLVNIGTSGNVTFNGVITGNTITSNGASLVLQSNNTTAITVDTSQNVTFNGYVNAPNSFGFKNRIINGGMVIDQRNAGAATANTINSYTLDRWLVNQSTTGKIIVQQNAGSVTPPVGFTYYLGVTSQSAYSVAAGDYYIVYQRIEGYNIADLAWGTASAKTITLSFQVYSSLTGTFGGALTNSGQSRSYPFTYTISSANTWTTISVTIAGDTSGTWLTTNGIGIGVYFGLGVGSTYSGTAGSWSGSTYVSATGATSVVGTSGATFYITGVQLEKGSAATSFDWRPYGTELQLCQRYYETSMSVAPADNMSVASTGVYAIASSAATPLLTVQFKVTKRTDPTVTYYAPLTTSPSGKFREDATGTIRTATGGGATNWGAIIGVSSGTSSVAYQFGYQASAEL